MIVVFHNLEPKLKINDNHKLQNILDMACQFITEKYLVNKTHLLNICFMNETEMAQINEDFVNHQGTTDVITFDFRDEMYDANEEDEELGEIYVCPAVAYERAAEFNSNFNTELILYCIHGMLHLFGYDDKSDDDRAAMRIAEKNVLTLLEQKYINFNELCVFNESK